MPKQTLIKKFFQEIEKGHYDEVVKLFAPQGKIHSPIYGSMDAASFYKKLSIDAKATKIEIRNIFIDINNPHLAAAYIISSWGFKTGKSFNLEGINIFEFTSDEAQFQSVKFIYDTYTIRQEFQ